MARALAVVLVLCAPSFARDAAVEAAKKKLATAVADPFKQRDRERAIRDLGKIGGKDAAAALVEVFDDPFEHLADHAVSAWITMLKGARADDTRAWLTGTALRHKHAGVRRGAAVALGVAKQSVAKDAVRARLAKEKDAAVLVALLEAWPRLGGGHDPAVTKLFAHKSGRVALAAAEASSARQHKLLSHRDPLGRAGGVLLAQKAGGLTDEQRAAVLADKTAPPKIALAETLDQPADLAPLLADTSWRVRAAVIAKLRAGRNKGAIPLLIERLAKEPGRLRLDAFEALRDLTGKNDLVWDAATWRDWWAANKDTFQVAEANRDDAPLSGERKSAAFFNVPVLSQRVVFLLDCSGSMRDAGENGGPTKFEAARAELQKTLADFDANVRFNVFLYRYPSEFPPRPAMTQAFKKLTPCKPGAAKKALAWLGQDKQAPKGWGAFYDGLKMLIDNDEVDTICFLSDGAPSRGTYDRDFRLITEIEKDNRFRRVAIHTVLVGDKGKDRTFMERLARTTGGRFADAGR